MARTDPEVPRPPEHLSQRAQGLWREIVPRRAVSPERLVLLQVALEALDRADAATEVIAQEGMVTTTKTTGAVHVHPLVKVEREALGVFTRCWRALGLSWSVELDGLVQVANVLQVLSDEQPMVGLHLASERPLQFRPLLPRPTPGQPLYAT